jgi:hypothetical protein
MSSSADLIAQFGRCFVCGAARDGVLYVDGEHAASYRLVCTADDHHGPDVPPLGSRVATDEDRERMRTQQEWL